MGKKTRREREKHVSLKLNGVRTDIPEDQVDHRIGWTLPKGRRISKHDLVSDLGALRREEKKLIEIYGADEYDSLAMYMGKLVHSNYLLDGDIEAALKKMRRWHRIRKYWPRMRRRLCDYCGAYAGLTEPRYLVCGGCVMDGEAPARYCSEECQRKHWGEHQKTCPAGGVVLRKRVPADVVD